MGKTQEDNWEDDLINDEVSGFSSKKQPKEENFPTQGDYNDFDLNDDLDDFDLMDDNFGNVPPMEKHSDLLKGLTKFEPFIRTLYNNWMGITWDEEEKRFKPDKTLKPIMNKIGSNWHASFIQTYVRENNILAHLNRDEYYDLLEDINRTLLLAYAKRYEEFGFTCYSDVIRVWNEVEDASLLALSGAGGGKYSDFLGGGIVQYRGNFTERQGDLPPHQYPSPPFNQKQNWFNRMVNKLTGTGKRRGGY